MGERDGIRSEAVLAVFLFFSVLLLLFNGTLKSQGARRNMGHMFQGVQRVAGVGSSYVKNGFGSIKRLREMRVQYEAALERLGKYQGLERNLVELRRQNSELKKILGLSAEIPYEHIPARIIGGDPSNLFSTITIDQGLMDGIGAGMAVCAFQDGFFGLLGKVVTVSAHSAQVRPILDPDHFVAGRLQKSRFEGLINGKGDDEGHLIMRYVRKSAGDSVGINELVVTSGMHSIYPPGIFIGRVAQIQTYEYATSIELVLVPVIDTGKTEYVFVLKEQETSL